MYYHTMPDQHTPAFFHPQSSPAVRPSTTSLVETVSISPREKEVLHLVSQGHTADEISSQLFISTNTVITHRKNLQQKLKARNTAHMVYLAHSMGLL